MFNQRKGGKWLRFTAPKELKLLVVKDGKVRLAVLNAEDSQTLISKTQSSKDDRLVGVYVKGGKLKIPGSGTEKETLVVIPDSVAPIRAIIGPDGQHNLEWICEGAVITVLLPLDQLTNIEVVTIREDIPKYRDATLEKNFNPV